MKIPIDVLIHEEQKRRRHEESLRERPRVYVPLYPQMPQRPSEEPQESNRGVVIISICGDD